MLIKKKKLKNKILLYANYENLIVVLNLNVNKAEVLTFF